MEREMLFVKPCWGVFREGDKRPLNATPSRHLAILGALGHTSDWRIVVVLDEEGKTVECLERKPIAEEGPREPPTDPYE